MDRPQSSLVIVWNADSSPLAEALDFLHKMISPSTYRCNLCRVTYGLLREKKEWAEFVKRLPFPAVFLHRDEFRRRYPELAATPAPAIFVNHAGGNLQPLAGQEELNQPRTVGEMKALILRKLATL